MQNQFSYRKDEKKVILFITRTVERIKKNEKKKMEHKQIEKTDFFSRFVANRNDILI